MIYAQSVSKTYTHTNNSVTVFKDINLIIRKQKVHLITGVSGSGKSTLLYLLSGLDTPTAGTISYNGHNIQKLSKQNYEHYRKAVSFVFQFPHLITELSVLENIMLSARAIGIAQDKACKDAHTLLERIGLNNFTNRLPHELSGGQKQRVALARALCSNPDFLFADEPTGSLDTNTGKEICILLRECAHELGIGVVLTSHDPQTERYADCIMELSNEQVHKKNITHSEE